MKIWLNWVKQRLYSEVKAESGRHRFERSVDQITNVLPLANVQFILYL